jgi:hypothetical protein
MKSYQILKDKSTNKFIVRERYLRFWWKIWGNWAGPYGFNVKEFDSIKDAKHAIKSYHDSRFQVIAEL